MDEMLALMTPEWARGPSTMISQEEGEELLASDQVLDRAMITGGMFAGFTIARTAKGLFRWPLPTFDDDDEEFELDDDDDEVGDVTTRPE